ncbi:MAG: hypothetical protein ACAH95_13815, partial [Fimbriimonas sp.]
MTQIQAIETAELTLSKSDQRGSFAMLFPTQADCDRVEDAFKDMGYRTGEAAQCPISPPLERAFDEVQRLFEENTPDTKFFLLVVAPPALDEERPHRTELRAEI